MGWFPVSFQIFTLNINFDEITMVNLKDKMMLRIEILLAKFSEYGYHNFFFVPDFSEVSRRRQWKPDPRPRPGLLSRTHSAAHPKVAKQRYAAP